MWATDACVTAWVFVTPSVCVHVRLTILKQFSWETGMWGCVCDVLRRPVVCAAARFVRLHDSRYTNGELYADAWPVRQQVCAGVSVWAHVFVCLGSYEALLKLDQRCCTMHSFNFSVMNILLSSSYQLQYYLSGWMYCVCPWFSFRTHCNSSSSSWNIFYFTWKEYIYSYCAFRSLSCAFDRSLVGVVGRCRRLEHWKHDVG